MLNFNSQENLMSNLQSSNALRGYLKEHPKESKMYRQHLKKVYEETGELPYKKYPGGVTEILSELLGDKFKEEIKKYTINKSYKFG